MRTGVACMHACVACHLTRGRACQSAFTCGRGTAGLPPPPRSASGGRNLWGAKPLGGETHAPCAKLEAKPQQHPPNAPPSFSSGRFRAANRALLYAAAPCQAPGAQSEAPHAAPACACCAGEGSRTMHGHTRAACVHALSDWIPTPCCPASSTRAPPLQWKAFNEGWVFRCWREYFK
jgi:hypothetical protein